MTTICAIATSPEHAGTATHEVTADLRRSRGIRGEDRGKQAGDGLIRLVPSQAT